MDDDPDPNPDDDLDFIFIDNTRQPLQGYSASMPVTGESGRVTVTLRFRVRCQEGYHGQDCNTICEANERCYSNGTVECVTGWESPDTHCNTRESYYCISILSLLHPLAREEGVGMSAI